MQAGIATLPREQELRRLAAERILVLALARLLGVRPD